MDTQGWHREDIKAAIRKRGITVTELSELNGLEAAACRAALIRGHIRGEQVIASFLGVAARELWPDRYHEDGTPKHPRVRRSSSLRPRRGHQQTARKCAPSNQQGGGA